MFAPALRRERRWRRLRVGRGRRPTSHVTPTGTIESARYLHERIDRPNLLVKIPATAEGVPAIRADDQRGPQHQRHVDLQPRALRRGDRGLPLRARGAARATSPAWRAWRRSSSAGSTPRSTAGSTRSARPTALALRGKAAVAQGKLAYELFREKFHGPRWDALAARGAKVQRPLWASTSTKNPAYPDTLYVDQLIGPDTVNTMPDADDRGVQRPRHGRPHGRRRRRPSPARRGTPSPASASTSRTSPGSSRRRAVAASRSRSTSSSPRSRRKRTRSPPKVDVML